MNELPFFIQILNRSIAASLVIAVVYVVRLFLKRFPKKYSFLLWLVVGIRLVCPVFVSSPLSLFNLDQNHNEGAYISTIDTEPENRKTNTVISATTPNQQAQTSVSWQTTENTPMQTPMYQGTAKNPQQNTYNRPSLFYGAIVIYLAGILGILSWNLYLVIRMKKKLQKAILYHGVYSGAGKTSSQSCIYESDCIASPFVLGLFQPRIYIPFRLQPKELAYIIKHE